jgi:hypothetical protein
MNYRRYRRLNVGKKILADGNGEKRPGGRNQAKSVDE